MAGGGLERGCVTSVKLNWVFAVCDNTQLNSYQCLLIVINTFVYDTIFVQMNREPYNATARGLANPP